MNGTIFKQKVQIFLDLGYPRARAENLARRVMLDEKLKLVARKKQEEKPTNPGCVGAE